MLLYTLGHSNHSLEKLVSLMQANGVRALVDVRSAPYSRYNPHFNKDNLEQFLPNHGLRYFYAGKYLGGRPSDPTCYKEGRLPAKGADYLREVDYNEVMQRPWFIEGINRLLEIAMSETAAIMCSEEDPSYCHRHHLIARYLLVNHPEVEVQHIRGDGVIFRAASILKSVDDDVGKQLKLF